MAMLFDTGCNIDCISYDTAKRLQLEIKNDKKYRIRDAQDNEMEILGDSRIYVAREGTDARALAKVVVIKELGQHQVILSLDTLKK